MSDKFRNRIIGYGEERPEQLLVNPFNYRIHPKFQQEALAGVLDEIGWVDDVIVNRTTGHVIDGHLRVELAISRKESSVPVKYVELSEAEEKEVLATFDPLSALADRDDEVLKRLLEEVKTDNRNVQTLLENIAKEANIILGYGKKEMIDPGELIDKAEELKKKWQVQYGDLWQCGKHRILCGDSTSADDVARVMQGEKALMVFTDPPYNLASDGKLIAANAIRKTYGDLKNSEWDKNFKIQNALTALENVMADAVTVYICTSQFLIGDIFAWMADWSSFYFYVVWCKDNPMPSMTKRHWTWGTELIAYATRGKHCFNFPDSGHALNWWQINSKTHETDHPTEKNPEVARRAILASSDSGAVVFDGFLGSGTTLVVCEQTGRIGRGIEIEPKYVAVSLERLSLLGLECKKKK